MLDFYEMAPNYSCIINFVQTHWMCSLQDGVAACIPSAPRGEIAVLPCIKFYDDKNGTKDYFDTSCKLFADWADSFIFILVDQACPGLQTDKFAQCGM